MKSLAFIWLGAIWIALNATACGKALSFNKGDALGDANPSDTGEVRAEGDDIGYIYKVTQVVDATQGNPYSTTAELPFLGAPQTFGTVVADRQWPFYFNYTYPSNNYKLAEARLSMDSSRDSSDTEGIFIDGILSGRPPSNQVNNSSSRTHLRIYEGATSGYAINKYSMDWALTHYKQFTRNSFDFDIADLISTAPSPSALPASTTNAPSNVLDIVRDGRVNVVSGDDSVVYQSRLFLNGYTISKQPLICVDSPSFTFQNVYLHNDGNTISSAAFSGTVVPPNASWAAAPSIGFRSIEFYYDPKLPKVDVANVTLTQAALGSLSSTTGHAPLQLKKDTSVYAKAAIVVNGVAITESGFDETLGNEVEEWNPVGTSQTYWTSFVSGLANNGSTQNVSLDLLQLFSESKLRSLLAQGKLNLAFAGSVHSVYGQAATSTRTYGVTVAGPELYLQGTYYSKLCQIPNDPSSPLSDTAPLPANPGDHRSPLISSLQAVEITSNSATVQWLTDEFSNRRVRYGVGRTLGSTYTETAVSTDYQLFHRVTLTGLLPYKVYTVRAVSEDQAGNGTISYSLTFQTLR